MHWENMNTSSLIINKILSVIVILDNEKPMELVIQPGRRGEEGHRVSSYNHDFLCVLCG